MLYYVAKKDMENFEDKLPLRVTLNTHLDILDTTECLKKRLSKRAA